MGFSDAFTKNYWLWFHIFAGGLLAKIMLIWFDKQISVLTVLGVALLWEVYESLKDDVEKIYGSYKRFFLDSIGDVIGAFIMAVVVVL